MSDVILPYNYHNSVANPLPLPVSRRELPEAPPHLPNPLHTVCAAIATANDSLIRIRLDTDSEHLARFFRLNWMEDNLSNKPDARILALQASPEVYGLPSDMASSRWYCQATQQVWMIGSDYYGNVKITVRGLCSELAATEEMFIHGCAMVVDGRGIVLSGMSGAGKTTLTAAIRRLAHGDACVVNDDWGPMSLSEGRFQFTREPHLHMKYPSIRTLAPRLIIDPTHYPSENFQGDALDPRARLLVPRCDVFGNDGVSFDGSLDLLVVVQRIIGQNMIPSLVAADLMTFEQGQYSGFYERTESFMNGSLFLIDEERWERHRDLHRRLLQRFHVICLNNGGSPDEGAELILNSLGHL